MRTPFLSISDKNTSDERMSLRSVVALAAARPLRPHPYLFGSIGRSATSAPPFKRRKRWQRRRRASRKPLPVEGIFAIDKPYGMTSMQVVEVRGG
jgi:hypothetical protein